jgi:hypothetical protein
MKSFHSFRKKLWLAMILGVSLAGTAHTLCAGETESGSQGRKSATEKDREIKKSPTFQEADKNGDHHVTKLELKKDYPHLLKFFDKVDTGEDGRLDEHEFENLIMENERDKEVRPI